MEVVGAILLLFMLLVFVINAVTLSYYQNMAKYFINLMQDDERKRSKFKGVVYLVLAIIYISNTIENLVIPIV